MSDAQRLAEQFKPYARGLAVSDLETLWNEIQNVERYRSRYTLTVITAAPPISNF